MTEPPRAVFLSYASEDAASARRIADALREGGIEVWFDQSELRGGDAWDSSIRRQIKSCKLFLAVISTHTQAREEGYFRREWNLAVARTLDMAEDTPFLLPVVIDSTGDAAARVPEKFREVQWTRLPDGATPATFVARVRGLVFGRAAETETAPVQPLPEAGAGAASHLPKASPRRAVPAQQYRDKLRYTWLLAALATLVVLVIALLVIPPWQRKEHARNVLLPEIESSAAHMYRSDARIFDTAMEAQKYLRQDPVLARLLPAIVNTLSIETEPAGAQVFWKDYETPTAPWRLAGTTPLKEVPVPRDYLRLEVRKEGYQTIELAVPMFSLRLVPIMQHLQLDPVGRIAPDMVRIPRSTTNVQIVGIDKYGPREVPEFLIDKFEVTNKQFKAFVDANGYNNPAWWTVPIREGRKVVPLTQALARFRDRTDRLGPATWEAGTYPDGAADQPVTGISWYEAAAYAASVHKQLPTVFHWAAVADTSRSEFLLPLSNFNHKAPTSVGSLAGFSTFGVYDLAGNAREWTYNQSGDSDQHFILGGGWTDPSYAFNDSFSQPSLDRSSSNGLRCITELAQDASTAGLRQSLSMDFRDYSREQPVNDATFATFARQFIYDKTPPQARTVRTLANEAWKAEVVSIDAGYNDERLVLYIFVPRSYHEPLQPVVFFPGSNGIHESTFDPTFVNGRLDFIIKSGRALIYPIYKGTYERQDDLKSDLQDTTVRYKDHVIMWVKEYSRTLDYLETRKDMQSAKVAYLGWSWGGFMGGIIPAVEKRIRAVVLNVGGMEMEAALPEVDQINFLPRVTQPVLMLNGSYDMYFPVETAQKPMFRLLGTGPAQKKMLVYPSGHLVPSTEFVKETLAWLDTYVGLVH